MDVFISYAREDSSGASRLYQDLLNIQGVTPWLDSKNLLPGSPWKVEVMQALNSCDLIIVLLSQHSVTKTGFVQREIAEALDKYKRYPPDRICLIPARLDDCRPAHPELHDIQWVDLFPDWRTGFSQIKKSISKLSGEPFPPPGAQDDVVMETIASKDAFNTRLASRGELRGCDAMELGFVGESYRGVDFSGANFVRCSFVDTSLQDCNLKGVNFEGAIFSNCLLAGADLWGVNFWGANVSGVVDLVHARFGYTNLFGTELTSDQQDFIERSEGIVDLGDYGSFIEYFSGRVGMTEEAIARTFIWINHRYFRMMFSSSHGSFGSFLRDLL